MFSGLKTCLFCNPTPPTAALPRQSVLCRPKGSMPNINCGRTVPPLAHMRLELSRAALIRTVALLPAACLDLGAANAAATSKFINPLTGDSKASWQSDDKSFDFSVPPGWTIRQEPRGNAGHLISASATRDAGGAELEVVCDIGKFGKSLIEYGPVEKAAERLLAEQPGGPTELTSATKVAGAVKGSFYYLYRYTAGGKACVTKQSVQQGRRYQLTLRTDPANGAAQQEVDGIVASFSSFPVNFICLGQSNKGNAPADGSCY